MYLCVQKEKQGPEPASDPVLCGRRVHPSLSEVEFAGNLVVLGRYDEARAILAEGGEEVSESRREIAVMLERVAAAEAG